MGTRKSGTSRVVTREEMAKRWKQSSGGPLQVEWGNDSCLQILGEHYKVVWLLATPVAAKEGEYHFWDLNPFLELRDATRFAMLLCDGEHYEPIFCTYRSGNAKKKEGCFPIRHVPRVVRETWELEVSSCKDKSG